MRFTWQRASILLCALLISACKIHQGTADTVGFTDPVLDSCRLEVDHHYYISKPVQINPGQKFPVIIIIDPHGDGLSGVQKFREALEDLPVLIAASNKIRNNDADFDVSLENVYKDLLSKYPVDPARILMAGFSGGARMALYYGLNNPVLGIIMFGAGPDNAVTGIQHSQIYGVSGTRDFNFIEQYRPLFNSIGSDSRYMNDYFKGTHAWPPERYILESVVFCLRESSASFQALSRELSDRFLEESDSLQNEKDLFFAGKALEKAWYFAGESPQQNLISRKINTFRSNPGWLAYQENIESLLGSEVSLKQRYAQHLVDPDTTWWSMEISKLYTQINDSWDPAEKDYYFRLKGFLGIYLYSQINRLLREKPSVNLLERFIWIYEKVEPDSEDLELFKLALQKERQIDHQ